MMKKIVIIKGIFSYIAALLFAIIFGLFLDANVGWFILLALILAPLISVLFAWISSRLVSVSCEMESVYLSKGDTYRIIIKIYNKSIFPTTPLAVTLTNQAGVRCRKHNLLVSVMPRTTRELEVEFQAKICGKSLVGIQEVRSTDYLGLFSFPVKMKKGILLQTTIAVIPEIAEISPRDDKIIKAMQTSLQMDDNEDTIESSMYSFGGFPGYDKRDYVPGDSMKRIHWKQSAKRNKLLVRLDDEMEAQSINVVLDSVFLKERINAKEPYLLSQYSNYGEDEIIPKIAEDAIENVLGVMQVLIRREYTVNFYARMGNCFSRYEILDDSDLENVRIMLAEYSFSEKGNVPRIPQEEVGEKEKVCIFSTPNSYEEAYKAFDDGANSLYTTIYSVIDEAKKQNNIENTVSYESVKEKPKKKIGKKEKILTAINELWLPYLLAFLLSLCVFGVFEVPVISFWTLIQAVVCAGIVGLCEYVRKHKIIGSLLICVLIVSILSVCFQILFVERNDLSYLHWFVSGGESVENTVAYLTTLILIFTVFFSMVIFYFYRALYRTSFLLAVSMVPFVIYVKVMQDIPMVPVVLITVLNIVAFLLNSRKQKDKGKLILGYVSGLVSLGLYGIILILIGFSLPEAETKYYYLFENAFLGGNTSEHLQTEYSVMSEFSGNADAFNELNNRKLYEISSVDVDYTLYFNRQTFDLYDYEYDRWYSLEDDTDLFYQPDSWEERRSQLSIALLVEAFHCVGKYEPELLETYGLKTLPEGYQATKEYISVETMNFPSVAYVTPINSIRITPASNCYREQHNTAISPDGIFQCTDGFLYENITYSIEFYDEEEVRNSWISSGGTNFDNDTAIQLLEQVKAVLEANNETVYVGVIDAYITETKEAREYQQKCQENTEMIPERVKKLALEITKNCTYDWEKAMALQNYFKSNDFVYDLSYRAPDDSVEYFLFEGKTGTCSDYASAYTLMARAAGLTVRYVEGFVPKAEFNGDYVVRTNCGHAYPEVYIQNVGYVVYEATQPSRYGTTVEMNGSIMTYFLFAGFRILVIIATIALFLIILLFVVTFVLPRAKERYFLKICNRATPEQAAIMIYRRIQEKYAKNVIKNGRTYTPYEYAKIFRRLLDYDLHPLTDMIEKTSYAGVELDGKDKGKAKEIYQQVKEILKEKQKRKIRC